MDCGRGGKRLPARGMSVPVSASPPFAAIIVAAGKGLRAGQPLPKQFAPWRGMPLLRHSALALADAGACTILVAIPDGADELVGAALEGIDGAICITGGATRQESVRNALERLSANPAPLVLIHDAARPRIPPQVITRLLDALERHPAAIPVLPVVDSLALDEAGLMAGSARREELRRVQTPQAFHFDAILAAHRAWRGAPDAGDDAQVARAAAFARRRSVNAQNSEAARAPGSAIPVGLLRGASFLEELRVDLSQWPVCTISLERSLPPATRIGVVSIEVVRRQVLGGERPIRARVFTPIPCVLGGVIVLQDIEPLGGCGLDDLAVQAGAHVRILAHGIEVCKRLSFENA